ncbi:MAG: hypothetical protein RDU20_02755 [Desulfomonilaceae bacterium]|nr:hypothetical protein [Desulfomonilaceae bacterium]
MSSSDLLEKFGERVGYTSSDMKQFDEEDPRVRHIERLSQAAAKFSIVAEVVSAKHCNTRHEIGDKFVLDVDGNFITRLCPKRMCIYLISQLAVPVALINERLSEGLDPNRIHFMRYVKCPDVGVECGGYGETMVKVSVVPRDRLTGSVSG